MCMYTYRNIYLCVHEFINICVYVYVHTRVLIGIMNLGVHEFTNMCVHVCAHVHVGYAPIM